MQYCRAQGPIECVKPEAMDTEKRAFATFLETRFTMESVLIHVIVSNVTHGSCNRMTTSWFRLEGMQGGINACFGSLQC